MKTKKSKFFHWLAMTIISVAVFARFSTADTDISYDYHAYINFFDALLGQSIASMLIDQLAFPYITLNQLPPFEIGFAILAKIFTQTLYSPEQAYAAMATMSIATRIHVMRKFNAPWPWILIINIYGITLLEANALRLGIASSLILIGIFLLTTNRKLLGHIAIVGSISIHLQVAIFVAPFLVAWRLKEKISNSITWRVGLIIILLIGAGLSSPILAAINNAKLAEYIDRGRSGSAGITTTSLLAISFFITALTAIHRKKIKDISGKLWTTTIIASIPSIVMLVTLTQIAVVGDRAWQLAFIIISSIIFLKASLGKIEHVSRICLLLIAVVSVINVTIRSPLSNFFNPIFPEAPIYSRI